MAEGVVVGVVRKEQVTRKAGEVLESELGDL